MQIVLGAPMVFLLELRDEGSHTPKSKGALVRACVSGIELEEKKNIQYHQKEKKREDSPDAGRPFLNEGLLHRRRDKVEVPWPIESRIDIHSSSHPGRAMSVTPRAVDILEALDSGLVYLPGGRDREGRPLIVVNIPSEPQPTTKTTLESLLRYFMKIFRSDNENGIVFVSNSTLLLLYIESEA